MEEDDGRVPITRQATKQKEKKYENDFIGAPSYIKISKLPTKRDVLKYLQKFIDDNTTKQGYRVRHIVSEAAEKVYFIWKRAITDRGQVPSLDIYTIEKPIERLYRSCVVSKKVRKLEIRKN